LPSSFTKQIHETLRDRIVMGSLAPGARLKVETLKQELNVAASPIREALSLLTSENLVVRFDQRGFRVADASKQHFEEILKLRCLLEGQAVAESVTAGGNTWEANLRAAHDALAGTNRTDDPLFEERHKHFHFTLLSACEAPMMLGFCNQLYDQNVRYRNIAGRNETYAARDVSHEHADICAAALDRDAAFASSLLQRHYRVTGRYLARTLESLEANGSPDQTKLS